MLVIVIGGGIAGISAAAELAAEHDVTVVEQEPVLAYHTTGRSAALFVENYGDGTARPLTAASRAFFDAPPDGFADHPLLSPRGALTVATPAQRSELDRLFRAGSARSRRVELLDAGRAVAMCPVLHRDYVAAAVWEPDAADIDVAALHQGFVRRLRTRGGRILPSAEVLEGHHTAGRWTVRTASETLHGDVVVNAAGAWSDVVAQRCGVASVGLDPRRRTAFMVGAPPGSAQWPMVIDAEERFYFKPDGTQLLCSPADETPSPPVDARPEETDVAIALDRINAATTLDLRHVRSQWAGLRTFSPDRAMVIGRDPSRSAFVWLAGQGGTGIQSAPAAARLAASIVNGSGVPDDILAAGLDPGDVGPSRFGDPA
jgi:D-arginine dehydrogenase